MNHLPLNTLAGESAASILAAEAAVSAEPATKRLANLSFRRGGAFLYSVPCRLQTWHQVLGDLYGSPWDILIEHSCFPAFAAGMSPESAARGVAQLQFGTRSRTVFPRLPALLEPGNRYGLRCAACAVKAMLVIGRQPSFVCHCLPFVTRCPGDGELLHLADESSTYEAGMFVPGRPGARHNSELYAACAYALLSTQSPEDLRANTLEKLTDCGYRRAGGRWHIAHLSGDWALVAREGFEDGRLTTVATFEGFPAWLLRAALREERPMHPAWLALLNWFIARQGESCCIAPAQPAARTTPSRQTGAAYRPSRADIRTHRQQWLAHKAAHPAAGRTALRRGLYAVWAWLYRNDRAWLLCHQPSNATKRGGRRSSKLEALLAPCVRVPVVPRKDRRGLLHLGTAYQVRVRLGVTDYAYGRLSAIDAGVSQQCISRVELARARVVSLQDALVPDPHAAALSVLARRVSLRESTLNRALHAVDREEHAR
ncbi:hypothetical protein CO705_14885 [Ralstonia pickettii]|nr:hypothetical protein CO705_14885 [Ralstonia pickettii]